MCVCVTCFPLLRDSETRLRACALSGSVRPSPAVKADGRGRQGTAGDEPAAFRRRRRRPAHRLPSACMDTCSLYASEGGCRGRRPASLRVAASLPKRSQRPVPVSSPAGEGGDCRGLPLLAGGLICVACAVLPFWRVCPKVRLCL